MKLAVVAAGFTPGEADQLRRAMGKWRKTGVIEKFRDQLHAGMKERGLSEEFAGQVFRQISGFGEYGFPESHAASLTGIVRSKIVRQKRVSTLTPMVNLRCIRRWFPIRLLRNNSRCDSGCGWWPDYGMTSPRRS